MSEKPKQVNFNSILLGLVNLMIITIGFFAKHEMEKVEDNQNRLWQAIMPRHEIEVELQAIKAQQNRADAEMIDLRSKLTALEISVAKWQK